MYVLFYEGEEPPPKPFPAENGQRDWASRGRGARYFLKLRRAIAQTSEEDRRLLLVIARQMARRKRE